MDKQELIVKWLSLFGESNVFALPDVQDAKSFNYGLNYSLKAYLDLNEKEPYGLFFTPNGNLKKKNNIGVKLVRSNAECEKYVAAYYVDIDIKQTKFHDLDECIDAAMEIVKLHRLPVSYVLRSGGGFHLYMFLEDTARILPQASSKLKELQEMFAGFFDGGDKASHSMAKLMRLPFSNHWKTLKPVPTLLYKVEWEGPDLEMTMVEEAKDIHLPDFGLLAEEHIRNYCANLAEKLDTPILGLSLNMRGDIDVVNKIAFDKVLYKLQAYPREIGDKLVTYNLKGTFLTIDNTDKKTGEVETVYPQGYRYNAQSNYINNFSNEQHSIEDRPRGGVYSFLYYYFEKNPTRVKEFLKESFSINLMEKATTGENIMPPIDTPNGTIFFTNRNVIYRMSMVDGKGKLINREITLFDIPLKIKGVMDSKYTMRGELDEPIKHYLIQCYDRTPARELIIGFQSSRSRFNDMYGQTGLVFTSKGDELLILDFYNALNRAVEAGQIPRYELEYLNGYHKNYFIIGDTFIKPDFSMTKSVDGIVLATQHIDRRIEGREQVTMKAYLDMIRSSFSDRVSITSFLTYITLFLGQSFWEPLGKYKHQLMIPGLIMSGKTKVGKSTLLAILKEGSGISADARKLSVRSTSPQPIKQAGTDNFILHLDEFTGDIPIEKESIVRDIINKARSSRGLASGQNVEYNYRSSILIDGERLPVSASVVNRCIVCAMFEQDRIGTEQGLYAIRPYCFLKDLIQKTYKLTTDDVETYYMEIEDKLQKEGLNGRTLMLYSLILTVNEMFHIIPYRDALEALKANLSTLGEISEGDELTGLISFLILTKRIIPRSTFAAEGQLIEIPLTDDIIREKQIDLISIIRSYKGRIDMKHNKLVIIVKADDADLEAKVSQFQQYFKH